MDVLNRCPPFRGPLARSGNLSTAFMIFACTTCRMLDSVVCLVERMVQPRRGLRI